MHTKLIIILAMSAKNNQYCVAGIDVDTKKFVRPISRDLKVEGAVPEEKLICSDGTRLNIFESVHIKFDDEPVDNLIQPENLYYDDSYVWKKYKTSSLEKIIRWRGLDNPKNIFYDSERCVDAEFVKKQYKRESLLLLDVKNLIIRVERDSGRPKFFAHFEYKGKKYWRFSVGDVEVRNQFSNYKADEYFFREEAVVLFSLTNPFRVDNRCYKMVAHVF